MAFERNQRMSGRAVLIPVAGGGGGSAFSTVGPPSPENEGTPRAITLLRIVGTP